MIPTPRFAKLLLTLTVFTLGALAAASATAGDGGIQAKLTAAKAGATVQLAAGEFTVTTLTIPTGVTVIGAGVGKTMLNAKGSEVGLLVEGGQNVTIKNLTVENASGVNLQITGSNHVLVESLLSTGSKTGVIVKDSQAVTIQNAVSASNRIGIALAKTTDSAVINCTTGDNMLAGLSASIGCTGAIFNNIFWQSAVGIVLDNAETGLKIDYNLYATASTGRLEGLVVRRSLAAWQKISNVDAHSAQFDVKFKDFANLDYTPVNSFNWRPLSAVTADWGVPSFGGFTAPKTDLAGQPRTASIDLGACATVATAGRAADGTFVITQAEGVKSAGIFTPDGTNIAYLFQNFPLRPGTYSFWVPTRNWQGKPIKAGDYEVRVAESNLHNVYIGMAGNMGKTSNRLDNCSWPEEIFAFDAQDRIIIAQNAFENGMGIRAFDTAYSTPRWMIPGSSGAVGAIVGDGSYYLLQYMGTPTAAKFNLRKLDPETGAFQELSPKVFNIEFTNLSQATYGMAEAKGKLFVSDPTQNKVFYGSVTDPKFTTGFDVPSPTCVSYDAKGNLLWIISNEEKLLALNPDTGAVVATVTPAAPPTRMNVNNGRLAYLSRKSGKVYVLDISNPQAPAPIREIGSGDGPFGPIKPDRFWFQLDPSGIPVREYSKWSVTLNSKGEVAVVDCTRVSFWGADGKLLKQGMGEWGQHLTMGHLAGDDFTHIWSYTGGYDIALDAKNKTWTPGTLWKLPAFTYQDRTPVGFFNKNGKNYGLYTIALADKTMGLAVIEFNGFVGTPKTVYFNEVGVGGALRHDDNGDGIIDEKDTLVPITMADGKRLPGIQWARYNCWKDPDGTLLFPGAGGAGALTTKVHFTGIDEKGNPIYDWANAEITSATVSPDANPAWGFTSPYDFTSQETLNNFVVQHAPLNAAGDFAQSFWIKSSAGAGLANGAGTDLAGFSKTGQLRWVNPLSYMEGGEGVQSIPDKKIAFSMWSDSCDYVGVNEDGLGVGSLAMPPEAYWGGMWSDHANQQLTFLGNDGKPYYVLGDYSLNCYHWYAIEGADDIKTSKTAFKLTDPQVTALAALPPPTPPMKTWFSMPAPNITVTKLSAPLPIDGDPNGWKAVPPTIIVTPELAAGDIHGPQDCSAIIRLAYFGTDLYVQTIVFDDVVSFHQPYSLMYQQDGIEMSINGFMTGFKINASRTTDQGDVVDRGRFAVGNLTKMFDAATVPRSIKVYDNAENVVDRKLLEGLGTDLTKSKVIVTEFKLPMTPEGVEAGDTTNAMPKMESGSTFWIGFFINDNDVPGGDVQDYIAWPQSYGTFTVKEKGAHATLE